MRSPSPSPSRSSRSSDADSRSSFAALVSARYALSPSPSSLAFAAAHDLPLSSLYPAPYASLSFLERHGTWVFFLAQPLAVSLEGAWCAATRRRVGGWAGRVWVALWVVGLGQASVGRSWSVLSSLSSTLGPRTDR